jgi:hypothetical protein
MRPKNLPENAVVATTDSEHRFYRLCSEWNLYPESQRLIAADIARNPQWQIKVVGDRLIYSGTRSLGSSGLPELPQSPQESNLSRLKEIADAN